MKPVAATFQYLKHRFKAKRWDSFHSPYLFHLFTTCCDDKSDSTDYNGIEKERNRFKASDEIIQRRDYGAGSVSIAGQQQKIAAIAGHALSSPFQCRFLARLVKFTQATTILEFGSSLGISGAYLAIGNPAASVTTVEGDPALASRSKKVFETLGLRNIQIITDTFESYISKEPKDISSIDILFLDGNHQSKALLEYYHALKHLYQPETVIVVDDIYWSADMQTGWNELMALEEVTQSVDCYHFGLLFFNKGFLQKENHVVKLPLRSVFR